MKEPKITQEQIGKYGRAYTDESFARKLGNVARRGGMKVMYAALLLYYVMKSASTTKKDKLLIIGALGYFISPIDVVPDVLLGIGYTDDLAVMLMALKAVWTNVTPEVKERAREKLHDWFSSFTEEDLRLM